jgi:hypothetical protein
VRAAILAGAVSVGHRGPASAPPRPDHRPAVAQVFDADSIPVEHGDLHRRGRGYREYGSACGVGGYAEETADHHRKQ